MIENNIMIVESGPESSCINEYYSEHYAGYLVDVEEQLDPRLKLVLNLFQKQKPRNILDIGCGNGKFASLLGKAANARVIGIDVSEAAVALARHHIEACRVDVGKDTFPFEDGCFDGIFCGDIIEHVFDTDCLLDEIYRVMARDGFCVLTTPNLAAWFNRISLAFGYQPFYTEVSIYHNVGKLSSKGGTTSTGHIRGFTCRSLKELLKEHNFRIMKVFGVPEYHIPSPLNQIDRLVSSFPSLASFIVLMFSKTEKFRPGKNNE